MDRFDERKPFNESDRAERDADLSTPRQGDILGLGGAPVPKEPGDPTTENDPESIARRRERAAGEDETSASESTETQRGPGATGIDMGSGGTGTDVTGR